LGRGSGYLGAEPGTLNEAKLAPPVIGVTRLSLGVENFDSHILEINGRAHRTDEIYRAYKFARSINFPQINIDLISGMVEETDENWRENVSKTIELLPDSVTIYQMEIPYNTGIYKEMKAWANWSRLRLTGTRGSWVAKCEELAQVGYAVRRHTAVDPGGAVHRRGCRSGGPNASVAWFLHAAGTPPCT
jgi:oxygen-independent coproporphyrinogen-3 oxidase